MKRKSKKERMYIYVKLIHFALQQKLTQHCKSSYSNKIKNKIFINKSIDLKKRLKGNSLPRDFTFVNLNS